MTKSIIYAANGFTPKIGNVRERDGKREEGIHQHIPQTADVSVE